MPFGDLKITIELQGLDHRLVMTGVRAIVSSVDAAPSPSGDIVYGGEVGAATLAWSRPPTEAELFRFAQLIEYVSMTDGITAETSSSLAHHGGFQPRRSTR